MRAASMREQENEEKLITRRVILILALQQGPELTRIRDSSGGHADQELPKAPRNRWIPVLPSRPNAHTRELPTPRLPNPPFTPKRRHSSPKTTRSLPTGRTANSQRNL